MKFEDEGTVQKAKENNCEIIIPEDCVVGTTFEGEGKRKNLDKIEDNEIILDIGFNTVNIIIIGDNIGTICVIAVFLIKK